MSRYSPMLCQPLDRVPLGPGWLAERKYDGHRALAAVTKDGVVLTNRNGGTIHNVPRIAERVAELCEPGTVLDGEIVAPDGWGGVQSVLGSYGVDDEGRLRFMVFDVLVVAGKDVRTLPLRDRKELLKALLKGVRGGVVRKVVAAKATDEFLAKVLADGGEGIVVKRSDSRYTGGRGRGWGKIKVQRTLEAMCIGFYDAKPGSKYEGRAVGGMRFRTAWGYEGRCAGMDDTERIAMFKDPARYVDTPVELAYFRVNASGALLSPQFRRMRTDKTSLTSRDEASAGSPQRKGRTEATRTAGRGRAARTARKPASTRRHDGPRRRRNYGAMTLPNLRRAIDELDPLVQGQAWHRCVNDGSGDPASDLKYALNVLDRKVNG